MNRSSNVWYLKVKKNICWHQRGPESKLRNRNGHQDESNPLWRGNIIISQHQHWGFRSKIFGNIPSKHVRTLSSGKSRVHEVSLARTNHSRRKKKKRSIPPSSFKNSTKKPRPIPARGRGGWWLVRPAPPRACLDSWSTRARHSAQAVASSGQVKTGHLCVFGRPAQ
jgi:hypothetical protein